MSEPHTETEEQEEQEHEEQEHEEHPVDPLPGQVEIEQPDEENDDDA